RGRRPGARGASPPPPRRLVPLAAGPVLAAVTRHRRPWPAVPRAPVSRQVCLRRGILPDCQWSSARRRGEGPRAAPVSAQDQPRTPGADRAISLTGSVTGPAPAWDESGGYRAVPG